MHIHTQTFIHAGRQTDRYMYIYTFTCTYRYTYMHTGRQGGQGGQILCLARLKLRNARRFGVFRGTNRWEPMGAMDMAGPTPAPSRREATACLKGCDEGQSVGG